MDRKTPRTAFGLTRAQLDELAADGVLTRDEAGTALPPDPADRQYGVDVAFGPDGSPVAAGPGE